MGTGNGCSEIESLWASKAFIRASENPIVGNGQIATDFAMGIKCRWSDSISDDTCTIRFIVGLEAPPQAIWGSSSNDLRWIWLSPTRIWKNCLDTCGRFGQSQPWKFGLDISLERPVEMLLGTTGGFAHHVNIYYCVFSCLARRYQNID
jgi:hypothetical protein